MVIVLRYFNIDVVTLFYCLGKMTTKRKEVVFSTVDTIKIEPRTMKMLLMRLKDEKQYFCLKIFTKCYFILIFFCLTKFLKNRKYGERMLTFDHVLLRNQYSKNTCSYNFSYRILDFSIKKPHFASLKLIKIISEVAENTG